MKTKNTCKNLSLVFFDRVYFVSRLTGPTYINIIGRKMTALIDMPTPVKKEQTKISFQLTNVKFWKHEDIILKAFSI